MSGKANFSVTGQAGTTGVGSITPAAAANVVVVGVNATGVVGTELIIWFEFDTTQTPNYSNITETQTPGWSAVSETQTPDWEEVA